MVDAQEFMSVTCIRLPPFEKWEPKQASSRRIFVLVSCKRIGVVFMHGYLEH